VPVRIAAALWLLAIAGAAQAVTTVQRTLPFGGTTRSYLLHVATGYDGHAPVPLVVDLHGLGSNAIQQASISGMARVADANGFVVAYPDGVNGAWNAGICCGNAGIDDVGFIRAVVAKVEAELSIDPARVYATGLSNGGALSQRLACDAADFFAAAAPMAFPVPFEPLTGCRPTRAMPVLTFMGLTDVLVHYDGGAFPSAAETFTYWHDVDGCAAGDPDERVVVGQSRCETYTKCTNGVQAGLCSITAASFGGSPVDGHVLYINPDFKLAEVAWAFFSQFTLPAVSAPVRAALNGTGTLAVGHRRIRRKLRWDVTLGDGTWAATDSNGGAFTGSAQRHGHRGRLVLGLTADAARALVELVGGHGTALTLDGTARIVARASRKHVAIAGRVRLNATVPSPKLPAHVRWTFRLGGRAR
jgi:polyhydroxybutyrate depolymerase